MTPGRDAVATDNPTKGKSKSKRPKRSKKVKEPKKVKAPKEPLVVFAFRLTATERDQIHKAAGPGKATRLVKGAALAAATGNTKAFEEITTQAKTNRK